jgi:hypothetical protein
MFSASPSYGTCDAITHIPSLISRLGISNCAEIRLTPATWKVLWKLIQAILEHHRNNSRIICSLCVWGGSHLSHKDVHKHGVTGRVCEQETLNFHKSSLSCNDMLVCEMRKHLYIPGHSICTHPYTSPTKCLHNSNDFLGCICTTLVAIRWYGL